MVDGVNYNPFTKQYLTAEEIQKLDENKDGIVSYEELNANMSWIASEKDDEGEVQIDESAQEDVTYESAQELDSRGVSIYNAALNNGAESTANSREELEQYLTKIESQYIEKLLDEAGVTGTSEAAAIVSYLKKQKTEFLNEYLQQHPEGPYDMEVVSASYIKTMDTAFAERQEGVNAFNNSIDEKKASAENFEALFSSANNVGNYMDPDAFQELKNKTVDYIIGQMLNGEVDEEFLSLLNSKYKNNVNYINAVNAIKSMQNQSDPVKMQEFLDKAEDVVAKLIGIQNTDGSTNLVNAINSKRESRQNSEYQEHLQKIADEMHRKYN